MNEMGMIPVPTELLVLWIHQPPGRPQKSSREGVHSRSGRSRRRGDRLVLPMHGHLFRESEARVL